MPTAQELIEADRRGELRGRQKVLFDAAVERGLIKPNTVTRGEALKRSFIDRSINTATNTPAAMGSLLAQAGSVVPGGLLAGAESLINVAQGKPANLLGEFSENRQQVMNTLPFRALDSIPRAPKGLPSNLLALNDASRQGIADPANFDARGNFVFPPTVAPDRPGFGGRFQESQAERIDQRERIEEEFPGTVAAGETASDVAAVISGRAPVARARAGARVARRQKFLDQAKESLDNIPDHLQGDVTDIFSSRVLPFLQETGRRLGRARIKSMEAGLEGAVLAAINDGDIASTAGLAIGGQAVGSASLFLAEAPVKRLLPAVGVAFVVSESLKAVGPGEQDFFASKDFAIQKMVAGLTAGLVAGMAGAGRIRGPAAERLPALMDAITAAPRSALISRFQELTNDSEAQQIVRRYATNPSHFTESQQEALGKALLSDDENAVRKEIDRLMDQPAFRDRVESL